MTTLHRKSLCPACHKAQQLITEVTENSIGKVVTHGEIIHNMPLLLEGALSYVLAEFNYDAFKESHTAVGVRLIAFAAERSKILLDAVTQSSDLQ